MIEMVTKNTQTGETVETEQFTDLHQLRENLASTASTEYAHDVLLALETGGTAVTVQNGHYTADTYTIV
jgi:hypothetical protein